MFVYVLTGFYRGQHGCIGVYSVFFGTTWLDRVLQGFIGVSRVL